MELKNDYIQSPQFISMMRERYFLWTLLLTPSAALQMLTKLDVTDFLSENAWIVNMEPFGVFLSNYKTVTKESIIFVTYDGSTGNILALSFGTMIEVKIGLLHHIDFYCHKNYMNNDKLLRAHVLKHLVNINQQELNKNILLSVLHPEGYPGQKVKAILNSRLGMVKGQSWDNDTLLICCYAQDIKASAKL